MIPVYGCRFYEKDELIKNYIPCKNADGVEGMLDVMSNEFLDTDSFLRMMIDHYRRSERLEIRQGVKWEDE